MDRRQFVNLVIGAIAGVMVVQDDKPAAQVQAPPRPGPYSGNPHWNSGTWDGDGYILHNTNHCYNRALNVTSTHMAHCPALLFNCEKECRAKDGKRGCWRDLPTMYFVAADQQ